ncbi:MAG: D-glycero-beta-D-manno-heptose 1-phosphate adenylyltransferase [Bacteroidales bacterium]|jgi:rfaE bifunctional protein nucleotidyltransferase chain/domain|nr:D-glycero-beta-D-manno-heptose 1-phosphate adenylyltransferase [Bacteroidales bacterium]
MSKTDLEVLQAKIITDPVVLDRLIAVWKFKENKIVFTNGCFDLIHRGHVEYLAKASALGDVLVVGLNTDASVRSIKGRSRPLQDEYSRALILAAMRFVDYVVLFDEDTPENLIRKIQPDVLVKGGDYKPSEIVGYDIVTAKGGKVVTIELVENFSTTRLIKKIRKSSKKKLKLF